MPGKPKIPLDGNELRRLYEVEKQGVREIAASLGVAANTVLRRLKSLGVERRQAGPEQHAQLRDAEWLEEQYVKQGKPILQIAEESGASGSAVRTWLEAHGIERRERNQHKGRTWSEDVRKNMAEAKKGKRLGAENPNWRGGLVHPDKRLRASLASRNWSKAVRERDGHKCVECGATGRLHAHHIKPWKGNEALRFELSNGKTLCPTCHQIAHGWKFPEWVNMAKPARAPSVQTDEDIV